jgi:hypothetical protein
MDRRCAKDKVRVSGSEFRVQSPRFKVQSPRSKKTISHRARIGAGSKVPSLRFGEDGPKSKLAFLAGSMEPLLSSQLNRPSIHPSD